MATYSFVQAAAINAQVCLNLYLTKLDLLP